MFLLNYHSLKISFLRIPPHGILVCYTMKTEDSFSFSAVTLSSLSTAFLPRSSVGPTDFLTGFLCLMCLKVYSYSGFLLFVFPPNVLGFFDLHFWV